MLVCKVESPCENLNSKIIKFQVWVSKASRGKGMLLCMVIILIKFVDFNFNSILNFRGCKDGLVNEVDGFFQRK
jgi:hypothetical protein